MIYVQRGFLYISALAWDVWGKHPISSGSLGDYAFVYVSGEEYRF